MEQTNMKASVLGIAVLALILCGTSTRTGEVSGQSRALNACRSVAVSRHLSRGRPVLELPQIRTSPTMGFPGQAIVAIRPCADSASSARVDAATGALIFFSDPTRPDTDLMGREDWQKAKSIVQAVLMTSGLTQNGVEFDLKTPKIKNDRTVIVKREAHGFRFIEGDHLQVRLASRDGLTYVQTWSVCTGFARTPRPTKAKLIGSEKAEEYLRSSIQTSPTMRGLFGERYAIEKVKVNPKPVYAYENTYFTNGDDLSSGPINGLPVHLVWAFNAEVKTALEFRRPPVIWAYVDACTGKVIGGGTVPSASKRIAGRKLEIPKTDLQQHLRSTLLAVDFAERMDSGAWLAPKASIKKQAGRNGRNVMVVRSRDGCASTIDAITGVLVKGQWQVEGGSGEALPSLKVADHLISIRSELKRAKLFKQCGYYDIAIRFDWRKPSVSQTRLRFPRVADKVEVENEYFEVMLAPTRPLRARTIDTRCSFLYPAEPKPTENATEAGGKPSDERIASLAFPAGIELAGELNCQIGEAPKYAAPNAFFEPTDEKRKHLELCWIASAKASKGDQKGTVVIYWSQSMNRPIGGRFDAHGMAVFKRALIPAGGNSVSPKPSAVRPVPTNVDKTQQTGEHSILRKFGWLAILATIFVILLLIKTVLTKREKTHKN